MFPSLRAKGEAISFLDCHEILRISRGNDNIVVLSVFWSEPEQVRFTPVLNRDFVKQNLWFTGCPLSYAVLFPFFLFPIVNFAFCILIFDFTIISPSPPYISSRLKFRMFCHHKQHRLYHFP